VVLSECFRVATIIAEESKSKILIMLNLQTMKTYITVKTEMLWPRVCCFSWMPDIKMLVWNVVYDNFGY